MIRFYKTDENLRIAPVEAFEKRCWVEMINPTDDEVEDIRELSGIPEEMLKAALDEEESARVDTDEGATMYVVDSPMMVDTEGGFYTTIPVAIIYNNKCIVTVSLNSIPFSQTSAPTAAIFPAEARGVHSQFHAGKRQTIFLFAQTDR
ncbi:MAG: CorA family divalent cation transporter [Christensenellaceae bacterium]